MKNGFTLIELLVATAIIGLLVALALPQFLKIKGMARESEAKENLHVIQLGVERFAVDAMGYYPAYLIGGSGKRSNMVKSAAVNAFGDVQLAESEWPKYGLERSLAADPLVREGYMPAYPRNPFNANWLALHQIQEHLGASRPDPARNGAAGPNYGTRFGPECNLMGNVMADPRYRKWDGESGRAGLTGKLATYADVEYRIWDMWSGSKPTVTMPGEFYYKSAGPYFSDYATREAVKKIAAKSLTGPILPMHTIQYILGEYGGVRDKGADLIGEERPFKWKAESQEIWPWTRSVVTRTTIAVTYASGSDVGGSPYQSIDPYTFSDGPILRGNSNGIRDGVVMVLTSGVESRLGVSRARLDGR